MSTPAETAPQIQAAQPAAAPVNPFQPQIDALENAADVLEKAGETGANEQPAEISAHEKALTFIFDNLASVEAMGNGEIRAVLDQAKKLAAG